MGNIDYTLNNFESVLARLNQSIVKIVDNKGKMCISAINPSVNDFLKKTLSENELEIQAIQKASTNYLQLKRSHSLHEIPQVIGKMFADGSILNIDFETNDLKQYFIASYIANNKYLNKTFQESIYNYFSETYGKISSFYNIIPSLLDHNKILNYFLHEPLITFFEVDKIINAKLIENLLKYLELEDLIPAINILDDYFTHQQFNEYCYIFENVLEKTINSYTSHFSVSEYCESKNISRLIDDNKIFDGKDYDYNRDQIYKTIKEWIEEDVNSDILNYLDNIKNNSINKPNIPVIDVDYDEIDNIILSYIEPDDDSWRDNSYDSNINYEKDIELIFER